MIMTIKFPKHEVIVLNDPKLGGVISMFGCSDWIDQLSSHSIKNQYLQQERLASNETPALNL